MSMMAVFGAILVGFCLGLLGSGGSILTVPILIYGLGQDEKVAIASSLAIVGLISLFGSIPYARKKQIEWRLVLLFGIPGVVGTYLGAWTSVLVSGTVQLMVFAVVMIIAAYLMIKPVKVDSESASDARTDESKTTGPHFLLIAIEGLAVGLLTGFVGVGGGFLIVPALVLLAGVSMHRAIATSLVIISLKSLVGFVKYADILSSTQISFSLIALFAVVGTAGCVLGGYVAPKLPQAQLKQGFGVLLIIMGIFILYRTSPAILGV